MTDKKDPWMKFYPSDWRGDPRLRMCSIGARGLWMEMMCIMHEADPYGHLMVGDVPVTNRQLASLAGINQPDCMKFMAELESAGVYSRQEGTRTIYSRRMVRDRAKSEEGRAHIRKRWPDGGGDGGGKPQKPTRSPNSPPDRSPTADPITPEARSQIVVAGADAREGPPANNLALDVADQLLIIAGHTVERYPLGWCGASLRVQAWLTEGWPPPLILAVARSMMAKRSDLPPPNHVQFFEAAIATEITKLARPLPKIEASDVQPGSDQSSVHVLRPAPGRGSGYGQLRAALRARRPQPPG